MISLKQLRAIIAVFEEGSFTRAAEREHATQSGLSQHVQAAETALGVPLFVRAPGAVRATPAGRRYYRHAVSALRQMQEAEAAAKQARTAISGKVRAGLMPAFTRSALAPVLDRFLASYGEVEVQIIEGYSGTLTEMVAAQALDFALVPSGPARSGLSVSHLATDREMLVRRPGAPKHDRQGGGQGVGQGVRLADLGPLDLIVPSRSNIRRAKLDEYVETHGVPVRRLLEMDAMMATLDLVAQSDWVTILPGLICAADSDGALRQALPIADPPLYSDFVVIEPSRQPPSPQARLFLEALSRHIRAMATP